MLTLKDRMEILILLQPPVISVKRLPVWPWMMKKLWHLLPGGILLAKPTEPEMRHMLDLNLKPPVLKSKVWAGKVLLAQEKEATPSPVVWKLHGHRLPPSGVITSSITCLILNGN